jgi:hypothetical protein
MMSQSSMFLVSIPLLPFALGLHYHFFARPKNWAKYLTADKICNEMHESARLEEAMRDQFGDKAGTGERKESAEEIAKVARKRAREEKRAKKKLDQRVKARGFKMENSNIASDLEVMRRNSVDLSKGYSYTHQFFSL